MSFQRRIGAHEVIVDDDDILTVVFRGQLGAQDMREILIEHDGKLSRDGDLFSISDMRHVGAVEPGARHALGCALEEPAWVLRCLHGFEFPNEVIDGGLAARGKLATQRQGGVPFFSIPKVQLGNGCSRCVEIDKRSRSRFHWRQSLLRMVTSEAFGDEPWAGGTSTVDWTKASRRHESFEG